MSPLQWWLQRTEPDLRLLDYFALHALEGSEQSFEQLREALGQTAPLDGAEVFDLAASLAKRGHVALAAHVAKSAPAGSPRRTWLLLAEAALVLHMPMLCLDALGRLPAAKDPAVQRLQASALADLGQWDQAERAAAAPRVRRMLDHRRAAAEWQPASAPTRPVQVVNLPSDVHRRRAIRKRLHDLGDAYRLVPGEDARALDETLGRRWSDTLSLRLRGIERTDEAMDLPVDGDRGNQVAHRRLWGCSLEDGCIVLEDDAYPYCAGIAGVLDEPGADFILFNARIAGACAPSQRRFVPLAEAVAAACTADPHATSLGNDGYALTARGAKTLGEALDAIGSHGPGLDFWTVAAALGPEEVEALPPSAIRHQLLRRRSTFASAGWHGRLEAAATGFALSETRDFGPARRSR